VTFRSLAVFEQTRPPGLSGGGVLARDHPLPHIPGRRGGRPRVGLPTGPPKVDDFRSGDLVVLPLSSRMRGVKRLRRARRQGLFRTSPPAADIEQYCDAGSNPPDRPRVF